MLTVGKDSYVTVVEADTYISNHYMSTDARRTAWGTLEEDDKEIVLRNATCSIENMPLLGSKKDSEQTLSFPRCYKNAYFLPLEWYEIENSGYHCEIDVPDSVKEAQIEEALELAEPSTDTENYERIRSGLQSYSMKSQSASYGYSPYSQEAGQYLKSSRAALKLEQYVSGGFDIR